MSDGVLVDGVQPMSQGMRVVNTFVAPSKTFADILKSASCWLPLVLMFLMTVGWSFAVDKTVGFAAASEVQVNKSSMQADALNQLPPDQRAQRMAMTAKITRFTTYGSIVFVLMFMTIETLILWGVFNFALGATTTFPQVFAVVAFAGLPRSLMWVLSAILLFAGVNTENFDMRNPVGTNLGYYLQDSPKWLSTPGTFLDVLGLWSMALLVIGMAIISKKKMSQSAAVIVGLWLLIMLAVTGFSVAMG